MAGEWIKVEATTPDKPEVLRVARMLGVDKNSVFGSLIRLWVWFDRNSVDGVVDGAVDADVDAICHQTGMAGALGAVGWLTIAADGSGVSLPNFSRHNGESAKKRALKNERQARWRNNVDGSVVNRVDARVSTNASTREEKRREEKILKPKTDSAKPIGDGDLVATLPSIKGEVEIRKSFVSELMDVYPGVMVAQEIDKARLWLLANPTKRKTNVRRFLTSWVARQQERA